MVNLMVRNRVKFDEAYRLFLQTAMGTPYTAIVPPSTPAADGRRIFYRVPDAVLPSLRDRGIEYEIIP